ncbi:hypothetical protein HGRIS_008276 [Hohenbuehelia grisea]|uniref:CP-type G domain-containing protein n=1 Tax=Hohenbuehelia grisea TaxID=104357 RepID=A0ABR3J7X2_9AGAR
MPRIRKKTSNRASTNDRRKLATKVREGKKKKAKAAKKNPQWKSKHKKDPGIPNDFPYKDQILAEVAEQRRQAAEEKQRRKDEKSAARSKGSELEEQVTSDAEVSMKEVTADNIASLAAKHLSRAQTKTAAQASSSGAKEDLSDNEDETPLLLDHELPDLASVIDSADAMVYVLDARDPLSFRSEHLEQLAAGKPEKRVLFILNKIDTCPREVVSAWANYLRNQHPTLLFRAASAFLPEGPEALAQQSKGKAKASARHDNAIGADAVLECLKTWAAEKQGDEPLAVAVLGLTNSGKSAFINSLLRRATLPVYTLATSSRGPSTTEYASRVVLGSDNESTVKAIHLIDTPGLSWQSSADSDDSEGVDDSAVVRSKDILLRCKGRIDKLKDPLPVVAHIVARASTEDLMLQYNLPAFIKGSVESFLSGVARSQQLVKKHGALDLTGAGRLVLRDWNIGKLPRYTTPPRTEESVSASPSSFASLYAKDDEILSTIPTKKEMRVARGLVKLEAGTIEKRQAALDDPWAVEESEDEDSDDDVDGLAEGDEGMGDEEAVEEALSEQEDEGDASEVEEPSAPVRSAKSKSKRKRSNPDESDNEDAAVKAPPRPAKRVAFSVEKSSKKASTQKPDVALSKKSIRAAKTDKASTKKKSVPSDSDTSPSKAASSPKSKSALKATSGPKPPAAKAKKSGAVAPGEEAYDFGKFF